MKTSAKHPDRIAAETKAKEAKRVFDSAINGTDEASVIAADSDYKAALAELVAAEMAHPSPRETSRRINRIRLENMGLCA